MKIVDHDQRRREVAETAARIIATEGIEALTTRRLAQAMGCSLGVLSHYFANKSEILLAALNWADQRIRARLLNAAEGSFELDHFKDIIVQVLPLDEASDIEWRVRLNLSTYALTHPELLQQQREQLLYGYQLTARLIEKYQHRGEIRPDIDPDQTARTVVDLMSGLALNLLLLPLADRAARVDFIDLYWEELRGQARHGVRESAR